VRKLHFNHGCESIKTNFSWKTTLFKNR